MFESRKRANPNIDESWSNGFACRKPLRISVLRTWVSSSEGALTLCKRLAHQQTVSLGSSLSPITSSPDEMRAAKETCSSPDLDSDKACPESCRRLLIESLS